MIAALIGGTGLTGSCLARHLLADPEITSVISVSRKPLSSSNQKLTEVLISDLSELPSMASRIRADLSFCCLGTTLKAAGSKENFLKVDHAAIVAFARVAMAHEARSFTLAAPGATSRGAHCNDDAGSDRAPRFDSNPQAAHYGSGCIGQPDAVKREGGANRSARHSGPRHLVACARPAGDQRGEESLLQR